MDFLLVQPIGFLSPSMQIALIAGLFILTTFQQYAEVKRTGKMFDVYPVSVSPLFAPIYEEILFRGFILFGLLTLYSSAWALVVSSLLFGLWHLKNIFWETPRGLAGQMLYAGFIFGPIAAALTLWSGTIWLAVIIHYLNNLWGPISKRLFERFQKKGL